jgi:hypothetical protein
MKTTAEQITDTLDDVEILTGIMRTAHKTAGPYSASERAQRKALVDLCNVRRRLNDIADALEADAMRGANAHVHGRRTSGNHAPGAAR